MTDPNKILYAVGRGDGLVRGVIFIAKDHSAAIWTQYFNYVTTILRGFLFISTTFSRKDPLKGVNAVDFTALESAYLSPSKV